MIQCFHKDHSGLQGGEGTETLYSAHSLIHSFIYPTNFSTYHITGTVLGMGMNNDEQNRVSDSEKLLV